MSGAYALGLDFGTNSVRGLLVDVKTGEEVATCVWGYAHGEAGVILDGRDPNLARQHPGDYVEGAEVVLRGVLAEAGKRGIAAEAVLGIGVDATGSTPLPVDAEGVPLALRAGFEHETAALAWLWKDHTAYAEAEEITAAAAQMRPEYLAKCGGRYSSEWYWAKLLHCARTAPRVFAAAWTWVEITDWIPARLCGTTRPEQLRRSVCTAGHKAMFHRVWGGYPEGEFLRGIDPGLERVRRTLPARAYTIADAAGGLSTEWAAKTGLRAGIPVAVGALDAHLGAVGSGIAPGVLVKIIGTSACDLMTAPLDRELPDIPGLCGIVPESILPGYYGLEAGQSAVGDIFNWFVQVVAPGGGMGHEELTAAAAKLRPGASGLLALDWHNGNRTVLADPRLTGLLLGLTLHSTPAEIYRALIEATAFGARVIMERLGEYGVQVEKVVNCGGIAGKNPLVMQVYADVMGRPLSLARSGQTCALGAAMAGAVAARAAGGGYDDFAAASAAMAGAPGKTFAVIPEQAAVYAQLYRLYRRIHDAFGVAGRAEELGGVMKELLAIRDHSRAS